MKDKEIRQILVEYIRHEQKEARVYHEKYIGSAICDVMVAAENVGLIGYEIKSDADNFERLPHQISAYNAYFDYNYIVVGEHHKDYVKKVVPAEWGILVIGQSSLQLKREVGENKKVKRSNQLSLLWAVELKNLLIANDMPLYAQKPKAYIISQLAERVPDDELRKGIVAELLSRDYSFFRAADKTDLITDDIFRKELPLPLQEMADMISEQGEDFTLAHWISIFNKGQRLREEKKRLIPTKDRLPHRIPYTDIEVSMGAPWISPSIIKSFILELLDIDNIFDVYYERITSHWNITDKHSSRLERCISVTYTYGIPQYNALQIIEATLNLRQIRVMRNGCYDEKATLAALEKQKLIRDEFAKWIWSDEDRRWEIEECYNRMFAKGEAPAQRKEPALVGINPDIPLYGYQRDAIRHILSNDNSLLAFDVGAGKTYVMIAAAMEMRREGLSDKNLFVVPNNIVGQWEKMFTNLYPTARVLAIEPKSFKPEMRQKILSQMRDGDYDGIIMAYSCFEMIGLSSEGVNATVQFQLQQIKQAMDDCRPLDGIGAQSGVWTQEKWWIRQQLEAEKKRMIHLVNGLFDNIKDVTTGITFDQLGVTTMFVDEAHNYKNLPLHTALKNIRGLNVAGSEKCQQMLYKIRHVQQSNGGRGVVFATGTPLCNSIADAFVMQTYLQPEELERTGLSNFDDWVKTFAVPEQVCEIDVTAAGYRLTQRFSRFQNLPELSQMLAKICVFHAMTDEKGLPYFEDYTHVLIDKSPTLAAYMEDLLKRSEKIRNKEVHPGKDNMLKVSTDGRKAALDLTLVERTQAYDQSSKIVRCVQEVLRIYHQFEGCSQLVFCDLSTPKGSDFSVYKEIKDRLIAEGVPPKQIAFIHSCQNEQAKLRLYDDVNGGRVRVLIGSTFKLGIGANVQTKLKAIHHLDIPWRPADMVQREGRIIRRGNENGEVLILRYIAEGSFDSYSWQILETKQRFISQFLSGSAYQRKASDLDDNVLTYAEAKALALDAPEVKALAEKENELRYYTMLHVKEQEDKAQIKYEIAALQAKVDQQETFLARTKENAALIASLDQDIITEQCAPMGAALTDAAEEFLSAILGFVLSIECRDNGKRILHLARNHADYFLEIGTSAAGNAIRLRNFFNHFSKQIEECTETIRNISAQIDTLQVQLQAPYQYPAEIARCENECNAIRESLNLRYN